VERTLLSAAVDLAVDLALDLALDLAVVLKVRIRRHFNPKVRSDGQSLP